ncbi:MAG: GNAT family N-acetyltransferase [Bacteroidales bacterium]|nr:GNAT family N-acetyltransferase [Bacteroidales bacterium]
MITLTPLEDSDHPHFAEDLFESAFPETERPDFDDLKKRPSNFHFMVATNDDEPIGILTYWTFEEFVYVEHFAIDEELRNNGFGKAVFLNFMTQHGGQVVMEVELPHDETSEYRVEFYASMGLYQNPYDYYQPSYHGDDRTVPMMIMSKMELDDDEFEEMRKILYKEVYKIDI